MRRRYVLPTVIALTSLAWALRFVQDDAFISFRYAAHLAAGDGLVWNVGERIEGYTNFLWTLLMAVPIRCGLDPISFSYGVGLVLFSFTLLATLALARRVTGSDGIALTAMIATGCNYTFAAYATGGLETCLQTCLVTTGLLTADAAAQGKQRHAVLTALAVLTTLALLTRLDSVLLLAGPFLWVAVARLGRSLPMRERAAAGAILIGIPMVVLTSWLVWKRSYYGDLLPNPFYLKIAHGRSVLRGVYYVGAFGASYLLVPFPFLWALRANRVRRAVDGRRLLLLLAPLVLWTLYVIAIGGDFMEFRLVVPVVPIFMTIAAASAWRWTDRPWRYVLVALLPVGSLVHALTFDRFDFLSHGMVTIPGLARQLDSSKQDWSNIGRYLRRSLGGNDVRIAVTAAGAIPYYSGLPAVDMLGVIDPWVARHGVRVGDRPGHQRIATVAYLRERDVDLVIGYPIVLPETPTSAREAARHLTLMFGFRPVPDPESLPKDACVLAIPFDPPRTLLAIALRPNRAIDDAIREWKWTRWPLELPP